MYIDMCLILIYLPIYIGKYINICQNIGKYINIIHISIYIGTHIDVSRYIDGIHIYLIYIGTIY